MSNVYKMEWDKQNTTQFKIKLNNNTDKDIIEWLDTLDNKQGTIKALIRKNYNMGDPGLKLSPQQLESCKQAAMNLFTSGELFNLKPGTFESLVAIHNTIFAEVPEYVVDSVHCGSFEDVEKMSQISFNSIVEKYVAMNAAASFKGGKGISLRIWLDYLFAKELRMTLNWPSIDANDYLLALDRSIVKDLEIKAVFKPALDSGEYTAAVFKENLDLSFGYEGY